MLAMGPACANRLIDPEEVADSLPTDRRIVSDLEVFTIDITASLCDSKRTITRP